MVDGDAFLSFAGTASKRDWQTNADVLLEAPGWGCCPPGMKTHRGFLRALRTVAPRILDALRQGGFGRLVVCGHSLGGALATMAGALVCCNLPDLRPRVCVVTFGAPQAGNAAFVDYFNATVPASARLVTPADPVPRSLSAQMVHVKGYVPVGVWSPAALTRPHSMSTYARAASSNRTLAVIAAYVPAILAAAGIVTYSLA